MNSIISSNLMALRKNGELTMNPEDELLDEVIDFGDEPEPEEEATTTPPLVNDDDDDPVAPAVAPATEPEEDEDEDVYASSIIKKVEDRVARQVMAALQANQQQLFDALAPALSTSMVSQVRSMAEVDPAAEEYILELAPQVAGRKLTKKEAQQIADLAMGKAYREGKLRPREVTKVSPVGGKGANLTPTQIQAAKDYYRASGIKLPLSEVLKYK